MDNPAGSGIDDDELNRMIANLSGGREPVTTPIVGHAVSGAAGTATPTATAQVATATDAAAAPVQDNAATPVQDSATPTTAPAANDDLAAKPTGDPAPVQDNASATATPTEPPATAESAAPAAAPEPVTIIPPLPENPENPANPDSDLHKIKQEALSELRPLVNKLDLPPEEKFDILLLTIRSSNDAELLPDAYTAARAITDETRRAKALLDIIKEADYFGQQPKG